MSKPKYSSRVDFFSNEPYRPTPAPAAELDLNKAFSSGGVNIDEFRKSLIDSLASESGAASSVAESLQTTTEAKKAEAMNVQAPAAAAAATTAATATSSTTPQMSIDLKKRIEEAVAAELAKYYDKDGNPIAQPTEQATDPKLQRIAELEKQMALRNSQDSMHFAAEVEPQQSIFLPKMHQAFLAENKDPNVAMDGWTRLLVKAAQNPMSPESEALKTFIQSAASSHAETSQQLSKRATEVEAAFAREVQQHKRIEELEKMLAERGTQAPVTNTNVPATTTVASIAGKRTMDIANLPPDAIRAINIRKKFHADHGYSVQKIIDLGMMDYQAQLSLQPFQQ